jgi:hypothetical protein
MHIDIISLILGAVLWELVIAYIHFVAKPKMRRRNENKSNLHLGNQQQNANDDYKSSSIGFNCKLQYKREETTE